MQVPGIFIAGEHLTKEMWQAIEDMPHKFGRIFHELFTTKAQNIVATTPDPAPSAPTPVDVTPAVSQDSASAPSPDTVAGA